jgi:hypothetical protein
MPIPVSDTQTAIKEMLNSNYGKDKYSGKRAELNAYQIMTGDCSEESSNNLSKDKRNQIKNEIDDFLNGEKNIVDPIKKNGQRKYKKNGEWVYCDYGFIVFNDKCMECRQEQFTDDENECKGREKCPPGMFGSTEKTIVKNHYCQMCPLHHIRDGNECKECPQDMMSMNVNVCKDKTACDMGMGLYDYERFKIINHECDLCEENTMRTPTGCVQCASEQFGPLKKNECMDASQCLKYGYMGYLNFNDPEIHKLKFKVVDHMCMPIGRGIGFLEYLN